MTTVPLGLDLDVDDCNVAIDWLLKDRARFVTMTHGYPVVFMIGDHRWVFESEGDISNFVNNLRAFLDAHA